MIASAYRLPRPATPAAYDVWLHASPTREHFAGSVDIALRVHTRTKVVELHARGLALSAASATRGRGAPQAARVVVHARRETVALHFAAPLAPGSWQLALRFTGTLSPGMHGLYLASDGHERAIVSQCEATDARAIFPCFDEPDLKATLRWRVQTEARWQVITNGVPEGRRKLRGSDEVLHSFAPTRVIPTYLAAVTIGAFAALPAQQLAGVPARVWAGAGKQRQTRFARAVTAQVLPWYEAYFGHRYNYQKLDQVAVPGFDAGAMENVGAIFYRQSLLLMTPGTTSWGGQKRIAEVIAHEIAHQWFGNLVTMKWWDDLWLNEAFATWMAYTACHAWQPAWRMWDDYLDSKEAALAADGLPSTHPIYTPVKSPAEATELFDVITYEKGCGVLRMAEAYLGARTFRAGIRRYVKAFKNSNAAGADLWNALGAAARQPVGALMQSWVSQPGFPLLQVTLEHGRAGSTLKLAQRRFYAAAKQMRRQPAAAQRWRVPIIYQYDAGRGPREGRALLTKQQDRIAIAIAGNKKVLWAYPNADATGFFRVQLDPAALAALLAHGLPHLTPGARMALIEDQWALVRSGLSDIAAFMDVLAAFRPERDHAVVRTVVGRLHGLHRAVVRDADRPRLAAFVRWLLAEQLEELGWRGRRGELPPQAVRRAMLVGALGEIGADADVVARAGALVEQELARPTAVEANLAGTVVALTARDGDAALLRRYIGVYQARRSAGLAPQLGQRYLSALACFERPAVVTKVLAACRDHTVPQDQLRTVLAPLLASRAAQQPTWSFLKRHWAAVGPRVGAMGVSRLVESTGALPYALRSDVRQFFAAHPVPEAKRALVKALEAMALRHELVRRTAAPLGRWLTAAAAARG